MESCCRFIFFDASTTFWLESCRTFYLLEQSKCVPLFCDTRGLLLNSCLLPSQPKTRARCTQALRARTITRNRQIPDFYHSAKWMALSWMTDFTIEGWKEDVSGSILFRNHPRPYQIPEETMVQSLLHISDSTAKLSLTLTVKWH